MAVLLIPPYLQFYDANGDPLSGGKVYTYQAGTTTPKATFTDNTETTQAANPVILDSAGRTTMWGAGSYKFAVYDSNNNLIRTTDNVSTYTTADDSGNSFFQAFSGTGSQTAFTLSQSLGTDENAIMVFVSDGLEQHVTNGSFATDTAWTKGAGWTIGAGVATATGAISTALSQTSAVTLLAGQSYNLIYTVTRSAGGIIPSIGGVNGAERTASGTYRETIIAGSTQTLAFTGNGFTGTLDDISITPADAKGYDIQSPTSYTLSGTTLTFATAPASGTGNIYVFAPSLLVAAANAAASAADASATLAAASAAAAAVSETNAAASAASLTGTSTTSLAIGTGTKSFTTQSGKFFGVGNWLLVTSDANPANYMHGQVTAYSGTSLDINVTNTGGSGTLSDWTIRVSGTRGAQGSAGAGLTNATATVSAFAEFAEATNNGSNKVTLTPPASLAADYTVTLPSSTNTLATLDGTETLTNKTLTAPDINGAATIERAIFDAGSASTAPIVLTSGTNLTTATAGSTEYDGKVRYFTPQGTQRGISPSVMFYRLDSSLAGANVNTAQSMLGVGCTLSSNTQYEFEIIFNCSKSAGTTSHNFGVLFGGTATLNNIGYEVHANTSTVSFTGSFGTTFMIAPQVATTINLQSGLTSATQFHVIIIRGTVSINSGGTFIPQYILSAAPGGAYTTAQSSRMSIWPTGASGANVSVGSWA